MQLAHQINRTVPRSVAPTGSAPRRRSTDKHPQRETWLQELCNRQEAELLLVRAENARLRRKLAQGFADDTMPAGLTV